MAVRTLQYNKTETIIYNCISGPGFLKESEVNRNGGGGPGFLIILFFNILLDCRGT